MPYLIFYPAVVAAAAFGGLGPGLLATLLSGLCVDVLFTAPLWQLSPDPLEWVRQGVFLAGGVGISVVSHLRRMVLARERRQASQLAELAAIVQFSDDAILSKDLTGKIQSWNAAAERLFGYRAEEVIGKPITLLLPPERISEEDDILERLRGGQTVEHLETARVTKDGRRIDVSVTVSPLEDRTGRLIGASKIIRDISERKQAEETLRQSEQRFRALVTASAKAMYRMSPDWSEMRQLSSRGFLAAMEGPDQGWIEQYIPAEDQPQVLAAIHKAIQSKSIFELEHRVRRTDGSVGWVLSRAVPLLDANGEVAEWFGAATDINARKQAQQALRESEEKFRALAEHVEVSFGIVQGERFVYANPYFARISGYSVDELLTMTFPQLVHPDFLPMMVERARRRQAGESVPNHYEFAMITKDGQKRWVDFSVSTIEYQGKPAIIGTGADITDRKHAEDALRESQHELQMLNQELEWRVAERTAEVERQLVQLRAVTTELTLAEHRERQRLAKVLHDHLQQLLVGTKFQVSILHAQAADDQIHQGLNQIDKLMDESLQVSRSLTAELYPPILHTGSLAEALRWLIQWMNQKHELQVHHTMDERANPEAEEVRLLLFEAVRELLFNIVKHAGVREACLEMVRHDGNQVRITIADSGKGFDVKPLHPVARTEGGFGMASIRQRLRLLGGQIEIDSMPGQGTRATLLAPCGRGCDGNGQS